MSSLLWAGLFSWAGLLCVVTDFLHFLMSSCTVLYIDVKLQSYFELPVNSKGATGVSQLQRRFWDLMVGYAQRFFPSSYISSHS